MLVNKMIDWFFVLSNISGSYSCPWKRLKNANLRQGPRRTDVLCTSYQTCKAELCARKSSRRPTKSPSLSLCPPKVDLSRSNLISQQWEQVRRRFWVFFCFWAVPWVRMIQIGLLASNNFIFPTDLHFPFSAFQSSLNNNQRLGPLCMGTNSDEMV